MDNQSAKRLTIRLLNLLQLSFRRKDRAVGMTKSSLPFSR